MLNLIEGAILSPVKILKYSGIYPYATSIFNGFKSTNLS